MKQDIKYICIKDFQSIKINDIVDVDAIHTGWSTQIIITFNRMSHIVNETTLQNYFKIMEEE